LALERDPERAAERGDCPLYDGKAASRKPGHAKRLAADDCPT
jgi:hypothetical protein